MTGFVYTVEYRWCEGNRWRATVKDQEGATILATEPLRSLGDAQDAARAAIDDAAAAEAGERS